MKKLLSKIDLPYKHVILASLFVNILIILGIIILRNNILPPEVPLFYGLPVGQEQLASSLYLIFPSIVSIFITLLNSVLATLIRDVFIKKSLVVSGTFSVLFPLAATLKIIFLVGSF